MKVIVDDKDVNEELWESKDSLVVPQNLKLTRSSEVFYGV